MGFDVLLNSKKSYKIDYVLIFLQFSYNVQNQRVH